MSGSFFTDVAKCIEYKNDYSEEYIVGENLVDDIDFDPTKVVAEWDTAIYAELIGGQLDCREDVKDYTMAATSSANALGCKMQMVATMWP